MKSIKEKAEEYTSDITNPVTNNAAFLAYKTGANYVLEQLEEFLNLYGVYCITSSGKEYLKDMIE